MSQTETINYTKEEFQKIKTVHDALKDFPKECKIKSYEIAMALQGSEKSSKGHEDMVNTLTTLFFEEAKKDGGVIVIEKIKSSCPSSSHKSKYKIVVEK